MFTGSHFCICRGAWMCPCPCISVCIYISACVHKCVCVCRYRCACVFVCGAIWCACLGEYTDVQVHVCTFHSLRDQSWHSRAFANCFCLCLIQRFHPVHRDVHPLHVWVCGNLLMRRQRTNIHKLNRKHSRSCLTHLQFPKTAFVLQPVSAAFHNSETKRLGQCK